MILLHLHQLIQFTKKFNTFNDLLAAKKVTSSDASIVIPRRNWTTGTTYDYYRHDYGHFVTGSTSSVQTANSATTLFDSNFYVMTDDFNVYKCLDNNSDAASTVKPSGTSTSILSTETVTNGNICTHYLLHNKQIFYQQILQLLQTQRLHPLL